MALFLHAQLARLITPLERQPPFRFKPIEVALLLGQVFRGPFPTVTVCVLLFSRSMIETLSLTILTTIAKDLCFSSWFPLPSH